MSKDKRLQIAIDEELLEQAKTIAWQERKSLAELIRELLENKIKENENV